MVLHFDLYTKKTKLYYIAQIISIITIGCLIVFWKINFQPKMSALAEGFFEFVIIVCVFISIAFSVIAGYGMLRTYIIDGELILSDDKITIDGTEITLDEVQCLFFQLRPRSRKSPWRLTGNRIEITSENGKTYSRRFAINSYDQDSELRQLFDLWKEKGIKYDIQDYIF